MNTLSFLEFLASVIDSLAWPVLVGFIVFLLRSPVAKLLDRLSRFKYKDLEAEFRDKLEDLKASSETEPAGESSVDPSANSISLQELAEVSPRAAIMEAWIKIERATENYLVSSGLEKKYSYQGLRRLPNNYKDPIEHILTAYQELRLLRNKAAHASDFELNTGSAQEYVQVSNYVVRELKKATK